MKDFYAILGVHPSASFDEIERAYRGQIQNVGKSRSNDIKEEKRNLRDAYYVLSDGQRRFEYDHFGLVISDDPSLLKPQTQEYVPYNGLEWEMRAHRSGREKTLLTHTQSLARLQKAGFERHPYSNELFSLVCDGLEGRLAGDVEALFKDILWNCEEWCQDFWVPGGIRYKTLFITRGSETREFSIPGLFLATHLNEFSPSLVEYICGRPYAGLPAAIQKNVRILFLGRSEIGPLPVGGFLNFGAVVTYSDIKASRGVRTAKK